MLRFGPFALDAASRRLTRGRAAIHLTPKAFDLLQALATEAPRVVGKSELHERLWPDTFVSDASLVELVKVLRRALDDRNPAMPVIRTAHRIGYALGLEVVVSTPRRTPVQHWLMIRDGRVALIEGDNVIGRDPEAQVWLDQSGASRRHARIAIDGPSAQLDDLGSKNGTTVGMTPVTGAITLRDGDRIAFGGMAAVYRESSAGMSTDTHTGGDLSSADGTPDTMRRT
jgi:DNA-binding winged helix-turn-helix (wHTH) protein